MPTLEPIIKMPTVEPMTKMSTADADTNIAPTGPVKKMPTPESVTRILKLIGEQITLARKRRMLSQERFARDFGMSRSTLRAIEKGKPGIALSSYIRIFLLMGKHLELIQFASTDLYGRKMQDERMLRRKHKLPDTDLNGPFNSSIP